MESEVRQAEALRSCVACLDEVACDVDAQDGRPEPRRWNSRGPVAASEIQDLEPVGDSNVATSASPLSRMLSAMRVKSPFSQSALFGFVLNTASYRVRERLDEAGLKAET